MNGFSINLHQATAGYPAAIEVSANYEKHIIEHIRKVVPLSYRQLDAEKEQYADKGMPMVRFKLPNVTNDQLSQIAWFVGEWYSRMEPLVNTNLN